MTPWQVPHSSIATSQPISVQDNLVFIVDIDKPEDIRADDVGSWTCNGKQRLQCGVDDHDRMIDVFSQHSPRKRHLYTLVKRYYKHATAGDCWNIWWVKVSMWVNSPIWHGNNMNAYGTMCTTREKKRKGRRWAKGDRHIVCMFIGGGGIFKPVKGCSCRKWSSILNTHNIVMLYRSIWRSTQSYFCAV